MVQFNPAIVGKLESLEAGLLNGHYIFDREINENYLRNRFSKPSVTQHNITYGVATEQKHKDQYYKIREASYKELFQDPNFTTPEDNTDRNSQIFIAKAGNNCVGGVRITVAYKDMPKKLPCESETFDLWREYPWLVEGVSYIEPSRLAIMPDFRDGSVYEMLQMECSKYCCEQLGVEIAFGRSAPIQTRRFRDLIRKMGYEFISRPDVKSMAHPNHAVSLWAVDFTPDRKYTKLLKTPGSQQITPELELELQFA